MKLPCLEWSGENACLGRRCGRIALQIVQSLVGLFLLVPASFANEYHFGIGAESRYISEGRDSLAGHELAILDFTADFSEFSSHYWHGYSHFGDYQERNLSFIHQQEISWLRLESRYTYLSFSEADEDEDDHELGLALYWPMSSQLSTHVSLNYSHQNQGAYLRAEAAYQMQLSGVKVTPYIAIGANAGYIPDQHRGADHIDYGVRVAYLTEISISLFFSAVTPLNLQSGDTLLDTHWIGFNINSSL